MEVSILKQESRRKFIEQCTAALALSSTAPLLIIGCSPKMSDSGGGGDSSTAGQGGAGLELPVRQSDLDRAYGMLIVRFPRDKRGLLPKPSLASCQKYLKPINDNPTLAGFAKAAALKFPPEVLINPLLLKLYDVVRSSWLQGRRDNLMAVEVKDLKILARAELQSQQGTEALGLVGSAPAVPSDLSADETAGFFVPLLWAAFFILLCWAEGNQASKEGRDLSGWFWVWATGAFTGVIDAASTVDRLIDRTIDRLAPPNK